MCRAVGKRGGKRSFRWKGPRANEWIDNDCFASSIVRRNDAARCLVDATAACLLRTRNLYRLLNLGRVSGNALFLRQLHLAILLAGNLRQLAAQLVRTETKLVAGLVIVFSSASDSMGTRRVPAHLLLL